MTDGMLDDLRIAVPPGWRAAKPDEGPVLLLASGPVDPNTGHAPTLVCSADGQGAFDALLRRSLAALSDPRVLAVEEDDAGRETIALMSHDVAGTGTTMLLRQLPDRGLVVTGSATDLAWPTVGPVLDVAVRTAGS